MQVFLASLIGKILEPIIRPIVEAAINSIKGAVEEARLNSFLNENRETFANLKQAKSAEEKLKAAEKIQGLIEKL